jgi:hypothetical protein
VTTEIEPEQLVPGHFYFIEFTDCCVSGMARDRFVRLNYYDETQLGSVEFERITLTQWMQAVFSEPPT